MKKLFLTVLLILSITKMANADTGSEFYLGFSGRYLVADDTKIETIMKLKDIHKADTIRKLLEEKDKRTLGSCWDGLRIPDESWRIILNPWIKIKKGVFTLKINYVHHLLEVINNNTWWPPAKNPGTVVYNVEFNIIYNEEKDTVSFKYLRYGPNMYAKVIHSRLTHMTWTEVTREACYKVKTSSDRLALVRISDVVKRTTKNANFKTTLKKIFFPVNSAMEKRRQIVEISSY